MTRKKVKRAFIANDSARKVTFKKRMRGLLKKVKELSTLCGVDACAIIFSPYDSQPEIWPSPLGVQRVLSQFRNMPEMEQTKKMVNHEDFLRQRIDKAQEQLKKQMKDNREKEITQVMFQGLIGKALFQGLNLMDLYDLKWLIEQNLKEICKRMETLNKTATGTIDTTTNNNDNTVVANHSSLTSSSSSSSSQAAAAAAAVAAMATSGGGEIMMQQILEKGGTSTGFDHQMNNNLMDAMKQRQKEQQEQWFLELMNQPQQHVGFGGDHEVMLPFGDPNCSHSTLWTNPFYHFS